MAEAKTCSLIAYEDTGPVLMARVVHITTGSVITQAVISSIAYAVYDVTGYDEVNDTGTVTLIIAGTQTISSVVFDTLQTPAIWTGNVDATGYNFRVDAPVSWIPAAPKRYRFDFKFTPTTGAAFACSFRATSRKLRTA